MHNQIRDDRGPLAGKQILVAGAMVMCGLIALGLFMNRSMASFTDQFSHESFSWPVDVDHHHVVSLSGDRFAVVDQQLEVHVFGVDKAGKVILLDHYDTNRMVQGSPDGRPNEPAPRTLGTAPAAR